MKKRVYRRASLVPYVIHEGSLYFMLGIDSKTTDISDIGGGIKKKETFLMAAQREFEEETVGIFQESIQKGLDSSTFIHIEHMHILFVPMKIDSVAKTKNFKKIRASAIHAKNKEIDSIEWVSETFFLQLAVSENSRLWSRIKPVYRDLFNQGLSKILLSKYVSFISS